MGSRIHKQIRHRPDGGVTPEMVTEADGGGQAGPRPRRDRRHRIHKEIRIEVSASAYTGGWTAREKHNWKTSEAEINMGRDRL